MLYTHTPHKQQRYNQDFIPHAYIDQYAYFMGIDDIPYCRRCDTPLLPFYEAIRYDEQENKELIGFQQCSCVYEE